MDATTNNTLMLSLKAFNKAEIQSITMLANIKAGKKTQRLLVQKINHQPSGQQTHSSSQASQWHVLHMYHLLLFLVPLTQTQFIHTGAKADHKTTGTVLQWISAIIGLSLSYVVDPNCLLCNTLCFDKIDLIGMVIYQITLQWHTTDICRRQRSIISWKAGLCWELPCPSSRKYFIKTAVLFRNISTQIFQ